MQPHGNIGLSPHILDGMVISVGLITSC
jgi:hypothetical protein